MRRVAVAVAVAIAAVSICASAVTAGPPANPNVLVVLVDDWGIDMLEAYGTGDFSADCISRPPTPNIDALMASGVRFQNAYAYPVCSPTRASLLTGRHPHRTGIGNIVADKPAQQSCPDPPEVSLAPGEFTIPEMMTEAWAAGLIPRYGSAAIGKWHLGPDLDGPAVAGFDSYRISQRNLRGPLIPDETYCRWIKNTDGTTGISHVYATTENVDDAVEFVANQDNSDTPWFLYLAFNAGHSPFHMPPALLAQDYFVPFDSDGDMIDDSCEHSQLPGCDVLPLRNDGTPFCLGFECPPEPCEVACKIDQFMNPIKANRARRPFYEAMIQAMDTELGRLLDEVDLDETLVILLGDNGTPGPVTWRPFIGRRFLDPSIPAIPGKAKGTTFEGGVRVPFIVAGAGVNDPGRTSDRLVCVVDIFATIAEALGINQSQLAQLPGANGTDSISFHHVLRNQGGPPRRVAFTEVFSPNFPVPTASNCVACQQEFQLRRALRDDRFKLALKWEEVDDPDCVPGVREIVIVDEQFFDLSVDPWEADPIDIASLDPMSLAGMRYTLLRDQLLSRPLPSF